MGNQSKAKKYRRISTPALIHYLAERGIYCTNFKADANGVCYYFLIDWKLEMEIDRFKKQQKILQSK